MSVPFSVSLINYRIAQLTIDCVQSVLEVTNTSFSGGHNQRITAKDSDFVLVFDSDAGGQAGGLSAFIQDRTALAQIFPGNTALTDHYPFAAP